MDNRNSFAMGALVAMVGVAVGASSVALSSDSVAFSGYDPNRAHIGVQRTGLSRTQISARQRFARAVRRNDRDPPGFIPSSSYQNPGPAQARALRAAARQEVQVTSVRDLNQRCLKEFTSRGRIHCLESAMQGIRYTRELPR